SSPHAPQACRAWRWWERSRPTASVRPTSSCVRCESSMRPGWPRCSSGPRSSAPARCAIGATARAMPSPLDPAKAPLGVSVPRIHRRDLNRTWEFLKLCFRDVNRETVEYQRPLSKRRFIETYGEEDVDQLLFEVGDQIVGYAECASDASGDDSWINM